MYSAACLNQGIEDTVALAILDTCSKLFPADPFKPLSPELRSRDSTAAVMALDRPAWLQMLVNKGLKAGAG